MQVKKYEAPTIQEALDAIKRELGPEAIILQTKRHRKGFGLMSRTSVEVTAAASQRMIEHKVNIESKLPQDKRAQFQSQPAARQAEIYRRSGQMQTTAASTGMHASNYLDSRAHSARDQVQINTDTKRQKSEATRYVDIPDEKNPTSNVAVTEKRIERQLAQALETSVLSDLEEKVKSLEKVIEELRVQPREVVQFAMDESVAGEVIEELILKGIDRTLALLLVRQAKAKDAHTRAEMLDVVAESMLEQIKVENPLPEPNQNTESGPLLMVFVGPTGVGKTTTIAKLAGYCTRQSQLKVGILNLDNSKPGAFEQLATYSRALNLPFRSVEAVEDLKIAVRDFKALDVVLIDSPGISHKDGGKISGLKSVLQSLGKVRCELVLSAVSRDEDLLASVAGLKSMQPEGIIFSKLDETAVSGCIYNIAKKTQLPLNFFATGQKVPEDFELATRERVIQLSIDL